MQHRNKFSHLPGPIAKANRDWEAGAIEKCFNDPRVAAAGLCPVCMCPMPNCLCVNPPKRLEKQLKPQSGPYDIVFKTVVGIALLTIAVIFVRIFT